MSLNNFYKLRKNFILLGLTGKMQAGADKIVELLSQEELTEEQFKFIEDFENVYSDISGIESRKIRRIKDFFKHKENWIKFDVVDYRSVILLFILHHNYDKNNKKYAENICNWIDSLGNYKEFKTPRFGGDVGIAEGSSQFLSNDFKKYLENILDTINIRFKGDTLLDFLTTSNISDFFFNEPYREFSKLFFNKLDWYSRFLRHKLNHVAAYCLRRYGTLDIEVIKENKKEEKLNYIYILADVINQLIKIHRKASSEIKDKREAHIIIDRLKNSYEMMYFKEKYSGFYMVVSSRKEKVRQEYIKEKNRKKPSKTDVNKNINLIKLLDDTEYKVNEFKRGDFDSFDVENCVQKSDYHIVFKEDLKFDDILKDHKEELKKRKNKEYKGDNKYYIYQPFIFQTLKLISLIQQPGLITPTYPERIMQIAFNAKLNSGCISRQVGAVVTDSHYSVKGIGWNEVPVGQIHCGLRDIRDLTGAVDITEFSNFEQGKTEHKYKDGEKFIDKITKDFLKIKGLEERLEGRPCSYCFKSFHNSYEAKDNQVHTRSLHAEENAMLQISKYGGQPLMGGNLFTTASPCELCSKKAFQLGIKNIFYIDLYPGISKEHILEGGKKEKNNPNVYQFQGVIGRSYQKLYEPFMSVKDETILRSDIKPSVSNKERAIQLKKLIQDNLKGKEFNELRKKLDGLKDEDVLREIADMMRRGVEQG
ncbi:hypothetical protein MHL31_02235 [Lutibacter sp. A80]|uniref:hypothetical protein n=1 Tax=Lutibacter sp. A80 TaxID=2918453 RepID=UPI001F067EC8|nr:hypothetical protein [Lutibacter sp. A80]UMB61031.1 hypothetical protein MHL31_02235 [Lutibacter sp. A80]